MKQSTIATWLIRQPSTVYWLGTATSCQEIIAHRGTAIENAVPLFYGEQFKETMTLSPWLAPIASFTELENDTVVEKWLTQGIFITSDSTMPDITAHLRSLLTAGLEGEEVLFRFYDPNVIFPMLQRMNETDKQAFFGNQSGWFYWNNGEVISHSACPATEFKIATAPWWAIKAEHLTEPESMETLAKNIARRLWEKIPLLMNALDTPERTILSALQYAGQHHFTPDDAQLWALANIIRSGQGEIDCVEGKVDCVEEKIDSVARDLLLSREEAGQLETFTKECV